MNFEKKFENDSDNISKVYKSVNIRKLQESFCKERIYLLFFHAISGCDTTSALYLQGKKKVVQLFQKKNYVNKYMDVFF